VGPDFGNIEQAATIGLSLRRFHDLHIELPNWEISTSDCIPQVLIVEVGIRTGDLGTLCIRQIRNLEDWPEVELAVAEFAIGCHQFEGVDSEACHSADRRWDAPRPKEMHEGVYALWLIGMEVPKLHN
jgi:hypothetical protein